MITPISVATPARAMKPTPVATDQLKPRSAMISTPPIRLNGRESMTIRVSPMRPKFR